MHLLQQNLAGSKVQSPCVRTKSACKSCPAASTARALPERSSSEDVSLAPSTSSGDAASAGRSSRRNVLAGLVLGTTASSLLSPQVPASQAAPFLESTGAKAERRGVSNSDACSGRGTASRGGGALVPPTPRKGGGGAQGAEGRARKAGEGEQGNHGALAVNAFDLRFTAVPAAL
eukprot:1158555-Pelagomonas_calceolata.AAC.3